MWSWPPNISALGLKEGQVRFEPDPQIVAPEHLLAQCKAP